MLQVRVGAISNHIRYDLSDLLDRLLWLISHDAEAKAIAQNGVAFAHRRMAVIERVSECCRYSLTCSLISSVVRSLPFVFRLQVLAGGCLEINRPGFCFSSVPSVNPELWFYCTTLFSLVVHLHLSVGLKPCRC